MKHEFKIKKEIKNAKLFKAVKAQFFFIVQITP